MRILLYVWGFLSFCGGSGLIAQELDTLTVAYTNAPPFLIKGDGDLEGVNAWLWEQVADELEIPYTLVPMNFGNMLDSIGSGHIDVSINPLTISSERSEKMAFTYSFYASNATIAVAQQSAIKRALDFIGAFLNLNFLRGLFVLVGFITVFGVVVWWFERKQNPSQFREGSQGIWDGLWWSVVTLTTVGYGDKAPKSRGGKIAALLLMFSGLLFISGLTAGIASSLTVNQLNSDPDNFFEFKDRTVGSVQNTETIVYLQTRFFKDVRQYSSVTEGLYALRDGEIEAFIYDEPILRYRIGNDASLEKIKVLPIKFDVQFYAFAMALGNTDLQRRISQKILEIVESPEWEIVLNEYGLSEL
ncbi:MAG: transporter substrate-binding domain-containing protein [Flavobacteriaceae bacterium]